MTESLITRRLSLVILAGLWLIVLASSTFPQAALADGPAPPSMPLLPQGALTYANEYTFGFYPYGWRNRDPQGNIVHAVQTSQYGLSVNASKAKVEHFGPLMTPVSGETAAGQDFSVISTLPAATMTFAVQIDGTTYTATSGAVANDRVFLQRIGRYVQHFEINDVGFSNSTGVPLSGVTGMISFYCWPDRMSATLNLTAGNTPLNNVYFTTALVVPSEFPVVEGMTNTQDWSPAAPGGTSPYAMALQPTGDETTAGIALLTASPAKQRLRFDPSGRIVCESTAPLTIAPGATSSFSTVGMASRANILGVALTEVEQMLHKLSSPAITAIGLAPNNGLALPVSYDPAEGAYKIVVYSGNYDYNRTGRVMVKFTNPDTRPWAMRLHFYQDSSGGSFYITGMSPILRDKNGFPIGLPVQISKDWHTSVEWFSGLTMVHLDAGQTLEFEFDLTYANWGKRDAVNPLLAVSHAQLSLVGYGGNQQWDEMAIGSFGESITYDADVNLGRSIGDDIRPLLVKSMGGPTAVPPWMWTNNVGGLDFLVYYQNWAKQYLSRQKTLYARYCPVLADVTYAGQTSDGAVQSSIRTQTWRADDYLRALYTIRYDVIHPTSNLTRLAFFQIASDNYNSCPYNKVARGTLSGLDESWDVTQNFVYGTYGRQGVALSGQVPWFAMFQATPPAGTIGAMANRGVIIRNWQARIGGVDQPKPLYSIYQKGNDFGSPSDLFELSPPANTTSLAVGDYVQTQVEYVVVPQFAADYLGPNQNLIAAVTAHPDSWELIQREAVGNNLAVTAAVGTVEQNLPVRIRTTDGFHARFSITGGIGYVPVTITGAAAYGPFALWQVDGAQKTLIDQSSALGNDWWQTDYNVATDTWDITFSLPLDSPGDQPLTRTYEWRSSTISQRQGRSGRPIASLFSAVRLKKTVKNGLPSA